MRVLIIDDEPVIRGVVQRLLVRVGHEALSAGGPETALKLLADTQVDVVLLDRRMPNLSGEALYLVLTHRWPYLKGRVVLMSGAPLDLDGGLPAELGSCHFLGKPFTVDQLLGVLGEIAAQAAPRDRDTA
ncbi:MAG: response regulator [Gemmatimonadales bacterium]